MSATFPVKDVLSADEFRLLWHAYGEKGKREGESTEQRVHTSSFSDQQRIGLQHQRKCFESETAKLILIDAFSGAAEMCRSDYEQARVLTDEMVCASLADDFHAWSVGKVTTDDTRSGMMPILARLIRGQIEYNPGALDWLTAVSLVPGIFTQPPMVLDLADDRIWHTRQNEQHHARVRGTFLDLTKAAFGIDLHAPSEILAPQPQHDNLCADVIASAIRVGVNILNPLYDSSLARAFVNAAFAVRPDLARKDTVISKLKEVTPEAKALCDRVSALAVDLAGWQLKT